VLLLRSCGMQRRNLSSRVLSVQDHFNDTYSALHDTIAIRPRWHARAHCNCCSQLPANHTILPIMRTVQYMRAPSCSAVQCSARVTLNITRTAYSSYGALAASSAQPYESAMRDCKLCSARNVLKRCLQHAQQCRQV
jgi:hypothetical protein